MTNATNDEQTKQDKDTDDEDKPRINPAWIMNQYNDNRDTFKQHCGTLWKQHRVFDLITYNLTTLYQEGVPLTDVADYYRTKYQTMLGFVKRNGYQRMQEQFKFAFYHQKRLIDRVGPENNDVRLHDHAKQWQESFPKVAEYMNVNNHITAKPYDVVTAAKTLASEYEDVERAWDSYVATAGLDNATYFQVFVEWNNTNYHHSNQVGRSDKVLNELLKVYDMLDNDMSTENIKDYLNDQLASEFNIDLED